MSGYTQVTSVMETQFTAICAGVILIVSDKAVPMGCEKEADREMGGGL